VQASRVIFAAALASIALAGTAKAAPSDQYLVRNLVSSTAPVPADRVDPNIKNAWGLVSSPTSPWWPANNGTNTSTIIPATGAVNNTVVQVAGGPTGIVFGGIANQFPITGGSANFIFNTMSGAISGWRSGTVSEVKVPAHDAFYLGLAIAVTATGPRLYSTDFKNNKIDVVDGQWNAVNTAGKFVDPNLPANYGPYGIQTVGNRIFVTYAEHAPVGLRELPGAGKGVVSAFDFDGNFLSRVATGGVLNAPWGIAKADPNFGAFGGDLLIGNFGDGRINAYEPKKDGRFEFAGQLRTRDHKRLVIDGLWALQFGKGAPANGPTSTLFFTAGPDDESHGLFGTIVAN